MYILYLCMTYTPSLHTGCISRIFLSNRLWEMFCANRNDVIRWPIGPASPQCGLNTNRWRLCNLMNTYIYIRTHVHNWLRTYVRIWVILFYVLTTCTTPCKNSHIKLSMYICTQILMFNANTYFFQSYITKSMIRYVIT